MESARAVELSSILNSSSIVAIGFLISGLLSILTRIVLARFLEPSGYGLISEGLAALSILTVVSLVGTQAGVSRFMSRHETYTNLVESALALVLPLSVIFTVVSLINLNFIASIFNTPALSPVLEALILNVPAAVTLSVFIGGFRGHEETYQKLLISMIFLPASILFLSSALTFIYGTAAMAAYGYTLSGWISALVAGTWYFLRFGANKPSLREIESLLMFSLPLGLKSILNFGIKWSSIIMIGSMLSSSAVGLFNAAYPISYGLLAGLSSINYLFMPVISRMHSKTDFEGIRHIYSTITRWLLIGTLPFVLVMVLKSEQILNLLFGNSYISAGFLLSILALGQFAKVLFGPLGSILIAVGETKQEALAKLGSLTVLVVSSVPLISVLGLVGAAVGFVLGSITGELIRFYYCRKHSGFNPFRDIDWKILVGGLLTTIVLLPRFNLGVSILQIIVSIGVYVFFIILSGVHHKEDLDIIERFLEDSPIPEILWSYPLSLLEHFSAS